MCWKGEQGVSGDSIVIDYLIEHESGSKNYHLYLRSCGRGLSDYMLSEEECLRLYNALKKTLELEKLI